MSVLFSQIKWFEYLIDEEFSYRKAINCFQMKFARIRADKRNREGLRMKIDKNG